MPCLRVHSSCPRYVYCWPWAERAGCSSSPGTQRCPGGTAGHGKRMPCRMRCRLLPSRSVSLETLSCLWQSVARVSAAAGDWGKINILLRRRSSSSSFTKAGREPMAASCCGLSAARAEAGSNNDSGVSCKQPGEGEKTWADGFRCLTRQAKEEEARRRPRLHEAWLKAAATGCRRGQGTDRARTPLWRVDTTLRPPIAIPPSA